MMSRGWGVNSLVDARPRYSIKSVFVAICLVCFVSNVFVLYQSSSTDLSSRDMDSVGFLIQQQSESESHIHTHVSIHDTGRSASLAEPPRTTSSSSSRAVEDILHHVSSSVPDVLATKSPEDESPAVPVKDMQVMVPNTNASTTTTMSRPPPRLYCEWKKNDTTRLNDNHHNCFQLLSPSAQSKPFWYFLGDSTMKHLFRSVQISYPFNRTIVKQVQAKCGGLSYLGFPTKNNTSTIIDDSSTNTANVTSYNVASSSSYWTPPNHTLGQGPVGTDKTKTKHYKPYCANAFAYKGTLVGDAYHSIEMLPVEFTLDVELPTPWTNTTQETVALYLQQKQKHQQQDHHQSSPNQTTACVVNAGMHDMNIPMPRHANNNMAAQQRRLYVYNVQQYLILLQPYCGTLIWLGLSATNDNPNQPQRNQKVQEWNQAVFDMLLKTMPHVHVMDVYDKSLHSPHLDNIHLKTPEYYKPLGALFVKLMK